MAKSNNVFVLFSSIDPENKDLTAYDLILYDIDNGNGTFIDPRKMENAPVYGYKFNATNIDKANKTCNLEVIQVSKDGKEKVVKTININMSDNKARLYEIPGLNVAIQVGLINIDPDNENETMNEINKRTHENAILALNPYEL